LGSPFAVLSDRFNFNPPLFQTALPMMAQGPWGNLALNA
jgi:hypothetical protein